MTERAKQGERRSRRARPGDPWGALEVIDALEVGPVRIEPHRLVAPYRVVRGGAEAVFELGYRYEEPVFDPASAADRNLAAMIAAQVALNYGLFCRRIVFRGLLDDADRRFLDAMAENSAREIAVKKFLEPNSFLAGRAASLPAIKLERYLRSELTFPDAGETVKSENRWQREPGRIAVLSSGGKDSLLSLGLLEEMGRDVYSVFVNESGRHWYTALNAYRHLRETRPSRTLRVWTNADRAFTWMLRHLPFVRPDFARLRSDQYPIRLWTVAVFLFGVLPVLRRRGIPRLVIGDEYDTTVRRRHAEIPHFDGIYDQSRFFDDELCRYYLRKRWPLCQFSILRPLSELLILRTLVERYPQLQKEQVSCHATHLEDGRVHPCGRCEKCRRVVAMLVGLGADPAACGYREEQVASSLAGLATKSISQERPEREHLAWLLSQRAPRIDVSGLGKPREHGEVVQLRFHPERSPPEWIPLDLRAPLLDLLRRHSEGALERRGRVWAPVDPKTSPAFLRPYAFDRDGPVPRRGASSPEESARRSYLLAELSWPRARERLRQTDTALLPVGAIEQHGPHLPLDVDAWDADHLCRLVAERLSDPRPLVLPLIPYGVSYHHQDFPGTLSVSPDTLYRMVYDVGMSAARNGITKLVIVNGHGGNAPTLQLAAQLVNRDAHIFTCVDTGETSDIDVEKLAETLGDVHAGEIETSTSLATRPELVDMSRAETCVPAFSSKYLDFSGARGVDWYAYTSRISSSGVLGDARKASREKGEKIWEVMVERLAEFIEKLKGLPLQEIYQRRY